MKQHLEQSGSKPALPDPYQRVTDRIIALLDRGTVPWQKPWNTATGPPANFSTGKCYRGINILLLGLEAKPSAWWMTYRQALERGGQVRKGEHGTRILKYGTTKQKEDAPESAGAKSTRPRLFLREFTVFNACQIDGIEFPPVSTRASLPQDQRIASAEAVFKRMPCAPAFREGSSIKACYNPAIDRVEMPGFGSFQTPEAYYSVLFHELVHSTGHQSRLARPTLMGAHNFADHAYSKEELVAEMGAAMLTSEIGIPTDGLELSASYLQSWLRVLKVKEHRRWIVEAAGQAAKATDFILGRTWENPETD